MAIQARLLAGMILVASVLFSASGYLQNHVWSHILFRRHVGKLQCTSYYSLQHLMNRRFSDNARNTIRKLFESGPLLTGDRMRTASVSLCREIRTTAAAVRREIENCNNAEEITANLHVFSGLCWENGTMTNFLDGLLAGFESVNYVWGNGCSLQIEPVMHTCIRFPANPSIGMQKGPTYYKKNIIEQEMCIAEGFDNGNLTACGNVQSLKRLSHIMNLFMPVGPGVTFQLSDFRL